MNRFLILQRFFCLSALLLAAPAFGQYVKDMPYFHQYSNQRDPSGSCQNTCVAMVLKYYGASDITPNQITKRWGTGVAKTIAGLGRVLNTEAAERGLGIRDINTERGTIEDVYALLDAGKPVIIHGRFSTAGHLVVLLGYDENYFYIHDPAGQWRQS
jgi:uncharacterized protein YvpB